MGFLSGLFGGGKTQVTQTTQQTTNVNADIDISNAIEISTEEIAAFLAAFGDQVTTMTAGTTEILKAMAQGNAIDLVSRVKSVELQAQFIDLLRTRTKQIGVALVALGGWWFFFRKKGRKK